MGGIIPTSPIDPHEPTVAEWDSFMKAIATAPTGAIVSMVIEDATGNPTVADFRIPCAWISVQPRFAVTPPVIMPPVPPAPTLVTMYVVSANGVFLHIATDTTIASRKGSLPFGTAIKVNPDTTAANGYLWRIVAAGEPNAGLFIAEKSADGAILILSTTAPGK